MAEGDGVIGAEERSRVSKGIFIEWILKLMVATSDMLIRRASGFLITPDDRQEITEG